MTTREIVVVLDDGETYTASDGVRAYNFDPQEVDFDELLANAWNGFEDFIIEEVKPLMVRQFTIRRK